MLKPNPLYWPTSFTTTFKQTSINSFPQDFNTWQQIAKTKMECEYSENIKVKYTCKITLKWEEKGFPIIVEMADAKNKKNAKRKALEKLVNNIICQGLIGFGFKEDNFLEKLPLRRKNSSDGSSSDLEDQPDSTNKLLFRDLLIKQRYQEAFQVLNLQNVHQLWNFGLKKKSFQLCNRVLLFLQGDSEENTKELNENQSKQQSNQQRQVYYEKQLKDPFQEDLTDFIRYYQLQCQTLPPPAHSVPFQIQPLPSEVLLAHSEHFPPNRQDIIRYFHPIEARKMFLQPKTHPKPQFLRQFQHIQLPKFQQIFQIPLKTIEKLYNSILFYSYDYNFCVSVCDSLQKAIKNIRFSNENLSKNEQERQKSERYYLHHKSMLTTQFSYILKQKISCKQLSIQGLIACQRLDNFQFIFNCKQAQQFLTRKLNKRSNNSQFQQQHEICLNEYVLLISKLSEQQYHLGYVIEMVPAIKLYIPSLLEDTQQPLPYTMFKLFNGKIYQKTSYAIQQIAKNSLHLFEHHTTLIWQPPTYPSLPVLVELLAQFISNKNSILLITWNVDALYNQITALGFKALKVAVKIQEKLIGKSNIVCSTPNAICCELLKNYAFTRVIIDEAHQISETLSLLAITKGCKELYLIGDCFMPRMQVYSSLSMENGMQISLFERLISQHKQTMTFGSQSQPYLRDTKIMQWTNINLYNQQLRLTNEDKTPKIKGFPWPSTNYRVCFLHHEFKQTFASKMQHKQSSSSILHQNTSNSNDDENHYWNEQAFICLFITAQVVKSGYTSIDQIGCLLPHNRMCRLFQQHFITLLHYFEITDVKLLAKIISTIVRAADGSKHFIHDLSILAAGKDHNAVDFKLINAALNAGTRGVIIVGDLKRLIQNPAWNNWLEWGKSHKLILQIEI